MRNSWRFLIENPVESMNWARSSQNRGESGSLKDTAVNLRFLKWQGTS